MLSFYTPFVTFYTNVFICSSEAVFAIIFLYSAINETIEGWFSTSYYNKLKIPDVFKDKFIVIKYLLKTETFMWAFIYGLITLIPQMILLLIVNSFVPLGSSLRFHYCQYTIASIDFFIFIVAATIQIKEGIRKLQIETDRIKPDPFDIPKRKDGEPLGEFARRISAWEKEQLPDLVEKIEDLVALKNRDEAVQQIKKLLIETKIAINKLPKK